MRVLITGVTGFVGGHMAEALLAEGGHAIHGLSREATWPTALAHLASKVELFPAELADPVRLETILRDLRPDWLFHFAGYANTGKSFHEPARCWADNLDGTRNLYDAVHKSGGTPRILFVSTGLVYGDADRICNEATELRPASPYAASKAAADLLSYQSTRHPGLDIVRVRLFNQIGPRQAADYAIANFARQIAAIEAGTQAPVLETGDLSAQRDITDVRDISAAFRLLMEKGLKGEVYNAGRGQTWRIEEILARLVTLSKVPVEVKQTIEPGRVADTAVTRADAGKLRTATGWEPRYALDQTLADVLAWWRAAR